LDALATGITRKRVNWVLDADFRDYFSSLDHQWLERFVEHRIADRRVLRLIKQWLAAGVIEDRTWTACEEGVPQGASVSPLLANIYLHYVFDLWAHQWRTRHADGDVVIVRFADDFVVGFEYRDDAERFWADLRDRLAKFSLELNAEKTRLVRFGRFAAQQCQERGLGKPETFRFLGFTHVCGKTSPGVFSSSGSPTRSGRGQSFTPSGASCGDAAIGPSLIRGVGSPASSGATPTTTAGRVISGRCMPSALRPCGTGSWRFGAAASAHD